MIACVGRWGLGVALTAVTCVLLAPAMAAGAAGDILVLNQSGLSDDMGGVIRVDPLTGERTLISENAAPVGGPAFANPTGISVGAAGEILVADQDAFGGGGGVIAVDPGTGARSSISDNTDPGPGFEDPVAVLDQGNGNLLVADASGAGDFRGAIYAVNKATGARSVVSSNAQPAGGPSFYFLGGMTFGPPNHIYVTSYQDDPIVIDVDLSSGARTLVSSNTAPGGAPTFFLPVGIVRAADGVLYVADGFTADSTKVIGVDPLTGLRSLISSNSSPTGEPNFQQSRNLAIDSNGQLVVTGGQLVRVDPITGARTLVSANDAPAGEPLLSLGSSVAVAPGDVERFESDLGPTTR